MADHKVKSGNQAGERYVFIDRLTLDAEIGILPEEHGRKQPVVISVVLQVSGEPLVSDTVDQVVSYAEVIDGIKAMVAEGHTGLVETLADRIAEFCLQDQRVLSVEVSVAKPTIIPEAEAVGVTVRRAATPSPALTSAAHRADPRVSVLIPAFRASETIGRAVESVLSQAYDDFEIVIASDDQCDYEAELAASGITDRRIRQVSTGQVGGGEAVARNAALAAARGEIIAPLDADDAFHPDRLLILVPLALTYGAATDKTSVRHADGTRYKTPFSDLSEDVRFDAERLLSPRIPFFPVFRRELVGRGWTSVAFAADVIFNLELLTREARYRLSCRSLYNYYKTDNSITQSPDTWRAADRGYRQILELLGDERLDLSQTIREWAISEFRMNQRLNLVFARYLAEGRCQTLEEFLDLTENGRAGWFEPELSA